MKPETLRLVSGLVGLAVKRPPRENRLGGLVVKASSSRAENPGFESRLRRDFSGLSHTSDSSELPCQEPGIIGSVLGLVGPVSVYCDWVRRKFDLQLLSQCGST